MATLVKSTLIHPALDQLVTSIAMDGAGNLYILSDWGVRITKYAPDGTITAIPAANEMGGTVFLDMAVDRAGNIFLTDGDSAIMEIPVGGSMFVLASGLHGPMGVAVDDAGNLIFGATDVNGYVGEVMKRKPDGTLVLVGTVGAYAPPDVAVDGAGNVYAPDAAGAVAVFHPDGTQGSIPLAGLGAPGAITTDPSGNVYVAENTEPYGRVIRVAPDGSRTTLVLDGFAYPNDLVVDAAGTLYALKQGWGIGYVVKRTSAGAQSTLWPLSLSAGTQLAVDSSGNLYGTRQTRDGLGYRYDQSVVYLPKGGDPVIRPLTTVYNPWGMAVDAAGNMYVSDQGQPDGAGSKVVKLTPGGVATTLPFTGLKYPASVSVDSAGNVYVADLGNVRVVKLTPGGTQTTLPFTGLKHPSDLVVDGDGNVFVTDGVLEQVVKLTKAGTQSVVTLTGFTDPTSVAVDAAGTLYVADSDTGGVKKVPKGGTEVDLPSEVKGGELGLDGAGNLYIVNDGWVKWSPVLADVPGAPTGVAATGGYFSAQVSWTPPASDGGAAITRYWVTPWSGGVSGTAQFTDQPSPMTFSGLENGTSYTFTVHAVNAVGDGAESTPSNAATPSGVPGPPVMGAVVAGNAQVQVSWTAPTMAGDSPVTGYVVTPYIGTVAQPGRAFASTATTQTVTGLTNGTDYTFRVAAVNAIGTGLPSYPSPLARPVTTPSAPSTATAVAGPGRAQVSWVAPASNGGLPVSGYVVTPYIGAVAQAPVLFASAATTGTVVQLASGTAYSFRVAARNALGTGPQSGASNAVTPTAGVPWAPTAVTAVAGIRQAVVSWTAPPSNGGAAVTGYVVTPINTTTAAEEPARTFSSTATNQTITGLTNGTSYHFKVAGMNAIGTGPASVPSSLVRCPAVPVAPTGVSAVVGSGLGAAQVTWTSPWDDGGTPITGYSVIPFNQATAKDESPRVFSSTATTQNVTGLANGGAYTFKVAAINAAGTGPYSDYSVQPVSLPWLDDPGLVIMGTAVAGNAQVTLSWTAPVSDGGSPITGYVVIPHIGATAQPARTFNSTATTQVITGLVNGTGYWFSVAAKNAIGTGPQSSGSNLVTPFGPALPGAPTIGVVSSGVGQAQVTWTAPASNGGSPVNGYVVTPYVGTTAQTARTFNSTATTQTVTGLTNGVAYSFKVAARTAVGTGPQSAKSGLVVLPFPTLTAFVQRQIQDFLGRAPTGTELLNGVNAINTGTTPAAYITSLRRSTDATTKVDPATRLYFAYFLRIPDRGGLTYWISQARAGRTMYSISDYFAASTEFKTRYGALSNSAFVTLVYQNILDRAPDTTGLAYWVGQLDSGAKSRGTVMVGFSESSEYKAKKAPSVDVAVTWTTMLAASPDTTSFNTWAANLTSGGKTVTDLAAALLADPRYIARV